MTERPILMSGQMVRACLSESDPKTQTRRVVGNLSKRFPLVNLGQYGAPYSGEMNDPASWGWAFAEEGAHMPLASWMEVCPYGVPGDRLWVRETYAILGVESYRVSVARAERMPPGKTLADTDGGLELIKVDPATAAWAYQRVDQERWKPAIFMPRWACRLVLEVTSVRVERLLQISVDDCFAEGIEPMRCPQCHLACYGLPGWGHDDVQKSPPEAYWHLWDQLNEARGYGRAKNPWVWVVTFKQWEER